MTPGHFATESGPTVASDSPREFPLRRGSGLQLGRYGVEDFIRRWDVSLIVSRA